MKTNILRKLTAVILIVVLFGCAVPFAYADPDEIKIYGFSLTLDYDLSINAYVTGADLGNLSNYRMLVWNSVPVNNGFAYSNADSVLTGISDSGYAKFVFRGLAAKKMADEFYFAVYGVSEQALLTPVRRYSIMAFAINKYNYTGSQEGSLKDKALAPSLIAYGAAAQVRFSYKTDRLASLDNFVNITLENGSFEDTTYFGTYKKGDSVTVTAPAIKDNLPFAAWKNPSGTVVSTNRSYTFNVTVGGTYRAVYGATVEEAEVYA